MLDGIKKYIDLKEISYTRDKRKKRKTSTLDDGF